MDMINIRCNVSLRFASSWLNGGVNNPLLLTAQILTRNDSLTDKMAGENVASKTRANQLEQWVLRARSSPDLVLHKEIKDKFINYNLKGYFCSTTRL